MAPPLRDHENDSATPSSSSSPSSIPSRNDASSVPPLQAMKPSVAAVAASSTETVHQHEAAENAPSVSFSHVHLYADALDDVSVYKDLESRANDMESTLLLDDTNKNNKRAPRLDNFETHDRDVIKQLIAGFGFRVTGVAAISSSPVSCGGSGSSSSTGTKTKSVLVTSCDPNGVKIIVTAIDNGNDGGSEASDDERRNGTIVGDNEEDEECEYYPHFDAATVRRFYQSHSNRQGIAVLAFEVSSGSIETIYQKYQMLHPRLVPPRNYGGRGVRAYPLGEQKDEEDGAEVKMFEVYAYYNGDDPTTGPDVGTRLRFVQYPSAVEKQAGVDEEMRRTCHVLPGLQPVEATFAEGADAAYCDHWVSNVVSRTGFLKTLEETLGFTPKVDFNAGVVSAGEAQIESTVTGNDSPSLPTGRSSALKDQSQVYLPINNALSDVGHVHGFLKEIGQGVQHVASRVDDLVKFVSRANRRRDALGEGFTFLRIPRSYYGVLTTHMLVDGIQLPGDETATPSQQILSPECANAVLRAMDEANLVSPDGAVDLDATKELIEEMLEERVRPRYREECLSRREDVVKIIQFSRYANLYSLLRNNVKEEDTYLSIVRNRILVDVQGDDLLLQIFTCNILQRAPGEEAPFFEFIQRVCSECMGPDGCPAKLKPGCGGFGIRNFLTLFLSIEVSKAMMDVGSARARGDAASQDFAQRKVDIFTNQLNESNPILTNISDAMTLEGHARDELKMSFTRGDDEAAEMWRSKMEDASTAKARGNDLLMKCSAKYKDMMKSLREGHSKE